MFSGQMALRLAMLLPLSFSFVNTLEGADLYRLRMLSIPDLHPGCTTECMVVVDHTRWPFPGPPLDSTKALQAFSFGLTLPPPLEYVSHTFNGTHLQQMIQGNPWYASVRPVAGGVTVGVVFDSQMQKTMPEGTSQIVLKLTLSVPAGTPSQQLTLQFRGDLGNPDVPIQFVMRGGNVTPAVQPRTVNVTPGTCFIPCFESPSSYCYTARQPHQPEHRFIAWYPAVAAGVAPSGALCLISAASPDAQGDAPVEEAEVGAGDVAEEPEGEEPPDPSTLEFPEPTADELVESAPSVPSQDPPAPGLVSAEAGATDAMSIGETVGGGSSSLGPSGGEAEVSHIDLKVTAPCVDCSGCAVACGDLPEATVMVDDSFLADDDTTVPPQRMTIQGGIAKAIEMTAEDLLADPPYLGKCGVVLVKAGTYDEAITIVTGDWNGHTITVISEDGPEVTFIEDPDPYVGDGTGVVVIDGEGFASTVSSTLHFGWTIDEPAGELIPETPPEPLYSSAGWHGFTIRYGRLTPALENDVNLRGGGIFLHQARGGVHIRGNVIADNPITNDDPSP
ncbi:MAG: hypothetical protein L0Z55_00730 [Planctomycetes bacterium]|nr:hypothetical protein [Planctomycetota bacterium]